MFTISFLRNKKLFLTSAVNDSAAKPSQSIPSQLSGPGTPRATFGGLAVSGKPVISPTVFGGLTQINRLPCSVEKLINQLVRNAKAQHTTAGSCKCFTCAVKLHLGDDNSGKAPPPGSLNFNVDPANPGPCSLPDNCHRSSRCLDCWYREINEPLSEQRKGKEVAHVPPQPSAKEHGPAPPPAPPGPSPPANSPAATQPTISELFGEISSESEGPTDRHVVRRRGVQSQLLIVGREKRAQFLREKVEELFQEPNRARKRTAPPERSAPKEKAPAVTRPDGPRLHSRTLVSAPTRAEVASRIIRNSLNLPLPENRERPAEVRGTAVEGSSTDPRPVKREELDKYVRKLELERNFVRKEEVKKAAQLALEAFCRYIDYSS